jgi:DNA primase
MTEPGLAQAPTRLYAAHAAAVTYYRAQLSRCEGPRAYLRERGLGAVVGRDAPWRVGYAPRSWTALTEHLRRQGFSTDELVAAGLAVRGQGTWVHDMFRDRIVFPIRDRAGHTVAFIGRIWRDASAPKYLNSPDTSIYTKGRELFGRYEQRDRLAAGWPPVLVEGPADTLAVWLSYSRTGRTGLVGVAPCGTALTAAQLRTAVELPGARQLGLAVAFDGDEAGRKAADHAYALLAEHPGTRARGAVFAPGADPADLLRDRAGPARLRTILERQIQPLLHLILDHQLDRLLHRSPRLLYEVEGRLRLARALAPLIAEQPEAGAVAALRHLATQVRQRVDEDPERVVADTLRCLTTAVSAYLEAPPSRGPVS